MKKLMLICLVSLCCFSLCSCTMSYVEFAEKMSIPYSAGEIKDGMYVNEEIGFTFPVPDSAIYTSVAVHPDENFTANPGFYRMSAKSKIFESLDSDNNPYLTVTAYYQKFPQAKKYESSSEYLEILFRNKSVSDAVTEYRGEWKVKNPVSEVITTQNIDPNYSYYTEYNVDNDKGMVSFIVQVDKYYIIFVFQTSGEISDDSSVFDLMNGIMLLEE